MQEVTVKVEGMSCRSCIKKIEGALDTIGAEGKVNFDEGTVDVKFDETNTEVSTIKEAIKAKGYDVAILNK
ncbi:cation transporter [Paenibacillus sp. Marseille-Q4541]|uniref:cation transporter n=1 Tax=Paenibacillus sp. Marseille-Q4541 TaxID=2831522 RepID=UPI001BA5919A|nr:cation transporter [Paenibacillus sp. Marseille-Q4541]